MRKAGVAHSKSSKDMESHVFLKAKTRVSPCWVWSLVGGRVTDPGMHLGGCAEGGPVAAQ